MRLCKMLGWEPQIAEMVETRRVVELQTLRRLKSWQLVIGLLRLGSAAELLLHLRADLVPRCAKSWMPLNCASGPCRVLAFRAEAAKRVWPGVVGAEAHETPKPQTPKLYEA